MNQSVSVITAGVDLAKWVCICQRLHLPLLGALLPPLKKIHKMFARELMLAPKLTPPPPTLMSLPGWFSEG